MATIDELGARAGERVRAQVRPYVSTEAPAFAQRPSSRRWAVVAAAVLVVGTLITLAVAGTRHEDRPPASDTTVASTTTTTTTGQGTDVEGNGLVFHLPPAFRYSTEGFASTGEGYGNFYSNAPLPHGPCTAGCGIGNLAPTTPNAVVIGIGSYQLPLDPNDHANTTIAGFDAHFVSTTECGDELISVRFGQDTYGTTIVRACLSGPDLAEGERTVREILASATRIGGDDTATPTTAVPDLDVILDPATAIDAPAGKVIATIRVGSGPGKIGLGEVGGPPPILDERHFIIDDPQNQQSVIVDRQNGDITFGTEPGGSSSTTTIGDGIALPQAEMFGADLRILWHGQHVRWHVPPSVHVDADGVALPDGSYIIQPLLDSADRGQVVRLFPDGSYRWWRLPKQYRGGSTFPSIDALGMIGQALVGPATRGFLEWPLPPHP